MAGGRIFFGRRFQEERVISSACASRKSRLLWLAPAKSNRGRRPPDQPRVSGGMQPSLLFLLPPLAVHRDARVTTQPDHKKPHLPQRERLCKQSNKTFQEAASPVGCEGLLTEPCARRTQQPHSPQRSTESPRDPDFPQTGTSGLKT